MRTMKKEMFERSVPAELTCDICGKARPPKRWSEGNDVEEIEVRMKTGRFYDEGGDGEETLADVCLTCFKEKVIPALEAVGCKFRTEEWNTY